MVNKYILKSFNLILPFITKCLWLEFKFMFNLILLGLASFSGFSITSFLLFITTAMWLWPFWNSFNNSYRGKQSYILSQISNYVSDGIIHKQSVSLNYAIFYVSDGINNHNSLLDFKNNYVTFRVCLDTTYLVETENFLLKVL